MVTPRMPIWSTSVNVSYILLSDRTTELNDHVTASLGGATN